MGLPPAVCGLVVRGSVNDAGDGGAGVELPDEVDEEVDEAVEVRLLGDRVLGFGLGFRIGFIAACCVVVI